MRDWVEFEKQEIPNAPLPVATWVDPFTGLKGTGRFSAEDINHLHIEQAAARIKELQSQNDYLTVMLAKLVNAAIRRETGENQYVYPLKAELEEMYASLEATEAVKNAPRFVVARI